MDYSIKLSEITNHLKEHNLLIETNADKFEDITITNLEYDSRNVTEGTLFFCKGVSFKEEYLNSSIKSGASCYISEKKYSEEIPYFVVSSATKAMSLISKKFYVDPSYAFFLTGITGTAGKTTTAYMIQSIFSSVAKGETGLISTNETYCGGEHLEAENTTPESLKLQRLFAEARSNHLPYVTMEVSSQAYSVNRVYDQMFNIGIFMNIDKDHIGGPEHPSYEHYRSCKLELINNSRIFVVYSRTKELDLILETASKTNCRFVMFDVNDDSKHIETFNGSVMQKDLEEKLGRQIFYYRYSDIKSLNKEGYSYTVHTPEDNSFKFTSNLPGYFNLINAAASTTAALEAKVNIADIADGLRDVYVPGRMNIYKDDDLDIIVDYAHNRLTLQEFLKSIKEDYTDRKLSVVIGAAGKNHLRREDIGKLCGQYANHIYLTEEDSDFEDTTEICNDIARFIPENTASYEIIPDRKEAIVKAIKDCKGTDGVIAILGKGNETFMKHKGKHIPYASDSAIVENEITKE